MDPIDLFINPKFRNRLPVSQSGMFFLVEETASSSVCIKSLAARGKAFPVKLKVLLKESEIDSDENSRQSNSSSEAQEADFSNSVYAYSDAEDEAILNYVRKDKFGYLEAITLRYWMRAEGEICPNRTAASLHSRYLYILKHLSRYEYIEERVRNKMRRYSFASAAEKKRIKNALGYKESNYLRGPSFTEKEDKALCKFITSNYDSNMNKIMWSKVEKAKICPGRDSYSLYLRFRRLRCRQTADKKPWL